MGRRDLLGTYLVDIIAMLLAMPIVLFPALAENVFGNPHMLGLLYSAETIGALVATASRDGRRGSTTTDAPSCWPPRRTARASRWPACRPASVIAMLFFALAGAADMISAVFRGTIWNQTIPDSMRGRLAGIEMLSYSIGPWPGRSGPASSPTAGASAGRSSAAASRCVAGVAITATWLHDFWGYDERTDEHAVAERRARYSAGEPAGPGAT